MPALKNIRREKFVNELVKGKSARAAYISAGYAEAKNSSRLMSNEDVQARLAELQAEYAEKCGVSKESITAQLQLAYDRGMELNQVPAAVAAARELSIIHGLRVERQEMAPAGTFDALSDKDYGTKLFERIQAAMAFAVTRPPSDSEQ
jgi:phage terminase small subunit